MAVAKPPLTVGNIKMIFGFLKYYDIADEACLESMVRFKALANFYSEHRKHIIKRRENVLRLFGYCENDFDKELLKRRYIVCDEISDIAYSMAYSDRMICIFLKRALERLSENTKNIAEFEY